MIYNIYYKEPHKRFIGIELTIENIEGESLFLQMPAWRPGRYELQNFARNIQKFSVCDLEGNAVAVKKISRELWEVNTRSLTSIIVRYNCYAYQMDAGGCWVDDEQLYINFIYCLLYVKDREYEPCQVALNIPPDFQVACGLPYANGMLQANDFYHLADSPMIASNSLLHEQFRVRNIEFHIWVKGASELNWDHTLRQFQRFIEEQIQTMGDFPEKDYHFLYQFLPFRQHHGVEHRNSTIITLGPSELLHTDFNYLDFLSISSHELFHAWNIVKIRPAEMLPYDLSKENYFQTGFVAEGVTTYYGEFFLARTGIFNQEQYFSELNLQFKKHFENQGNYNLSLADSSFDLWVDGYVSGIPNRKVSIYVKGALIAFILDVEIRKATLNKCSLDDLMKKLWEDFGKKNVGYTLHDYQKIAEAICGISLQPYFDECVFGTTDLKDRMEEALRYIGCLLWVEDSRLPLEKTFGLRVGISKDGKTVVDCTEPGAPADALLSKDDEVIAINGTKVLANAHELTAKKKQIEVSFFRKNKLNKVVLKAGEKTYFRQYKIVKNGEANLAEKENFRQWLKSAW